MATTATKPATTAQAARRAATLWDAFDPMADDKVNDARWEQLKSIAEEHPEIRDAVEQGNTDALLDHNRNKTGRTKGTAPSVTRERRRNQQAAAAAKRPASGGPKSTGAKKGGAPARRPGAGSSKPARTRSRRGRAAGGLLPTPARAFEQTGIPGGVRSTAQLVLEAGGLVVGLSLAYLLLTNAQTSGRGKAAIELVAKAVQTALAVFINPVDPLSTLKIGNPTSGGDTTNMFSDVAAATSPAALLSAAERKAGIIPGGLSFPPVTQTPQTPPPKSAKPSTRPKKVGGSGGSLGKSEQKAGIVPGGLSFPPLTPTP